MALLKLDDADIKILSLLQDDARLSSKAIAKLLGKSLNPIYERIRKLEENGYIKKYVAIVDRTKISRNLVAYTNVQLKEHSNEMLIDFEKRIVELPEIMECHHMTGMYDYLLRVVVRDMDEYHNFVLNKISKISNIAHVQSSFLMNEIKHETKYLL